MELLLLLLIKVLLLTLLKLLHIVTVHTIGGSSRRLRAIMRGSLVQLLCSVQQQHDVAVLLISGW